MNLIDWSTELELGEETMDATHREFVELLNAVGAATDEELLPRLDAFLGRLPSGFEYAVEVRDAYRRLSIAGQVGVRPDGSLPESGEEQIAQAWANVLTILAAAGMTSAPSRATVSRNSDTSPDGHTTFTTISE